MEETLFLGKTISYWVELNKRVEELNVEDLIKELAELHSKVSFYEHKLDQINDFRKHFNNQQSN